MPRYRYIFITLGNYKTREQSKCPSKESVNILQYIHTMECHEVSKDNEVDLSVLMWKNLSHILLYFKIYIDNSVHRIIPFMKIKITHILKSTYTYVHVYTYTCLYMYIHLIYISAHIDKGIKPLFWKYIHREQTMREEIFLF